MDAPAAAAGAVTPADGDNADATACSAGDVEMPARAALADATTKRVRSAVRQAARSSLPLCLPPELLARVLGMLPRTCRRVMRLVGRHWRDAMDARVTSLRINTCMLLGSPPIAVYLLLSHGHQQLVQRRQQQQLQQQLPRLIAPPAFPSLQSLVLQTRWLLYDDRASAQATRLVANRMWVSSLTSLDARHATTRSDHCPFDHSWMTSAMLADCSRLSALSLRLPQPPSRGVGRFRARWFAALASLRQLEDVRLYGAVHADMLRYGLGPLPRLTALTLGHCDVKLTTRLSCISHLRYEIRIV